MTAPDPSPPLLSSNDVRSLRLDAVRATAEAYLEVSDVLTLRDRETALGITDVPRTTRIRNFFVDLESMIAHRYLFQSQSQFQSGVERYGRVIERTIELIRTRNTFAIEVAFTQLVDAYRAKRMRAFLAEIDWLEDASTREDAEEGALMEMVLGS